jgi:hypothetical protein
VCASWLKLSRLLVCGHTYQTVNFDSWRNIPYIVMKTGLEIHWFSCICLSFFLFFFVCLYNVNGIYYVYKKIMGYCKWEIKNWRSTLLLKFSSCPCRLDWILQILLLIHMPYSIPFHSYKKKILFLANFAFYLPSLFSIFHSHWNCFVQFLFIF